LKYRCEEKPFNVFEVDPAEFKKFVQDDYAELNGVIWCPSIPRGKLYHILKNRLLKVFLFTTESTKERVIFLGVPSDILYKDFSIGKVVALNDEQQEWFDKKVPNSMIYFTFMEMPCAICGKMSKRPENYWACHECWEKRTPTVEQLDAWQKWKEAES